jgi:iron(III) transport system ATP-binding protein
MNSTSFLDLRGICKSFGQFIALSDIHLTIQQGELVCFLGPSGCGKTTLLRVIAGLETQTSGEIYQAGKDISRLAPAMRDYGIVFQSYALFPNLTVAENIAYGLVNQRKAKADISRRINDLLQLIGLPNSESKYPSQLSGGQQQRIALARALATNPSLLLLDEPLSALDALVRVRLRSEIKSLQQKLGVTTIMVTHDQEEALAIADRIVVMNCGVIEQIGTPLEVYREPASPFVADFVGKANAIAGRVKNGRLNIGGFELPSNRADGEVNVFLRPEDIIAEAIAADDPYQFDASIEKIEFLGSFCHAHVTSTSLQTTSNAPFIVYFSLNFLTSNALQTGSTLRLKLLPERLRVF